MNKYLALLCLLFSFQALAAESEIETTEKILPKPGWCYPPSQCPGCLPPKPYYCKGPEEQGCYTSSDCSGAPISFRSDLEQCLNAAGHSWYDRGSCHR